MDELTLTTSVVSDTYGFRQLAGEWDGLLEQSAQRTYFLHWDWNWLWWTHFAPEGATLHVICCRDATGALAGLAPLYLVPRPVLSVFPMHELQLMGTGIAIRISEFVDIVAPAGLRSGGRSNGREVALRVRGLGSLVPPRRSLGRQRLGRPGRRPRARLSRDPVRPGPVRRYVGRLGRVQVDLGQIDAAQRGLLPAAAVPAARVQLRARRDRARGARRPRRSHPPAPGPLAGCWRAWLVLESSRRRLRPIRR